MKTRTRTRSTKLLAIALASLSARRLQHPPALNRAASTCAGFTLIELLHIAAIIAMILGLILPAIQKVREAAARTEAANNLRQAGAAFQAFYDQNGNYPETWKALADWCNLYPALCGSPYLLPHIEQEGLYKGLYGWQYSIVRITPPRSLNATADPSRPPFRLEAEPIYPGITGSETLVLDQNGNLTNFQTPGSGEGRRQMFDRIRRGAAERVLELLDMDESALSEVREFVASPEAQAAVLDTLDATDDGLVSLLEIRSLDTGSEITLTEFLDLVIQEMKFEMLSPELSGQLAVEIAALSGNAADQLFSFDGLCSLTRLIISTEGVANQLCATLRAAKAAAERGDSQAKARFIRAYINDVESLAPGTLTRRRAATLITLAQTL